MRARFLLETKHTQPILFVARKCRVIITMSLFKICLHAGGLWDSHHLIKGAVTGSIFGRLIVKHGFKEWPAYQAFKGAMAESALNWTTPHFDLVRSDLSKKVLEQVLDKKYIAKLSSLLRKKITEKSAGELYAIASTGLGVIRKAAGDYFFGSKEKAAIENSSSVGMKDLISSLYNNFSTQKAYELTKLLFKREFAEFTQVILTATLQPVSEKMVQAFLSSLTKSATSAGIDFALQSSISLAVQTVVYKPLVSSLFHAIASQFHSASNCVDAYRYSSISMHTFLMGSAVMHVSLIGWSVLQASYSVQPESGMDKKELHALILKYGSKPIEEKLRANPLFKYLEDSVDQSTIDSFIFNFTEAALDFYWEDLKKKEILGLPLVA